MRTNGTWVTPNDNETKNAVSKTRYTTDLGHLRGVLDSRFCKSGVDSCALASTAGGLSWSWTAIVISTYPRKELTDRKVCKVKSRKDITMARLKQRLARRGGDHKFPRLKHEIAHYAAETDRWYLRTSTWPSGK